MRKQVNVIHVEYQADRDIKEVNYNKKYKDNVPQQYQVVTRVEDRQTIEDRFQDLDTIRPFFIILMNLQVLV